LKHVDALISVLRGGGGWSQIRRGGYKCVFFPSSFCTSICLKNLYQ
jgi:hypothetical protein